VRGWFLAATAGALLAATPGCGNDDEGDPAAGAANQAGSGGAAGTGGTAPILADEECPKTAGENPDPGAPCATVGNTCSVRNACGVCLYDETCDYYADGPVWEIADPLQNTGRSECPSELPVNGAPCSVSFIPYRPPCEYCDGAIPTFAACLEGAWRYPTYDYCP